MHKKLKKQIERLETTVEALQWDSNLLKDAVFPPTQKTVSTGYADAEPEDGCDNTKLYALADMHEAFNIGRAAGRFQAAEDISVEAFNELLDEGGGGVR